MDIKRIIGEYYEQLYAHKFDNWDEMDRFLEKQSTKIQGEIIWIGLYLTVWIINNLLKQSTGPRCFYCWILQKKHVGRDYASSLQSLPKIETKGIPTS